MKRVEHYPSPLRIPKDTQGASLLSSPVLPTRRNENRSRVSLALVPIALLGLASVFSLVQRAAASLVNPEKPGAATSGKMTQYEAQKAAAALCAKLTGSPASALDISQECAYSWKRHVLVREWNVLCDSPQGQFLIRINADSGRVYGVNRMGAPDSGPADPPRNSDEPAVKLGEETAVSRTLAEKRAREYLRIVGVPSQSLTQMQISSSDSQGASAEDSVPQWNFTYQNTVPGVGRRLLKVSINGETGGLEHVWNPVLAL